MRHLRWEIDTQTRMILTRKPQRGALPWNPPQPIHLFIRAVGTEITRPAGAYQVVRHIGRQVTCQAIHRNIHQITRQITRQIVRQIALASCLFLTEWARWDASQIHRLPFHSVRLNE